MAPKSLRGVELLLGVTAETVKEVKDIRRTAEVWIQQAFWSMMVCAATLVSM